jgi:hypothetical protein
MPKRSSPVRRQSATTPLGTTAVSILDRLLHHATGVITDGDSYRIKDAQHRKEQRNLGTTARGGYFRLTTSGYFNLAIDITSESHTTP